MATRQSAGDTRDRILTATNELFRRQGFNGTSLAQVVDASGATTGSLYHFFPGGKTELTAAVLRSSGAAYRELIELILTAASDPAEAMTDAFDGAAATVDESGFIDPCPIGTITSEVASTNEELRQVASEVIASWVDVVERYLIEAGIVRDRAHPLATLAVASIEGSFMMSRAHRNTEALAVSGRLIRQLVASELANVSPS